MNSILFFLILVLLNNLNFSQCSQSSRPKIKKKHFKQISGVYQINDENFDDFISQHSNILLRFFDYSQPESQIQSLRKNYSELIPLLENSSLDVKLADVSSYSNIDLVEKFQILQVPSYIWIHNKLSIQYLGSSNITQMLEWIQSCLEQDIFSIESYQQLQEVSKSNRSLVLFFGNRQDNHFELFANIAKLFPRQILQFAYTDSQSIKSQLKIEFVKLILFQSDDELTVKFQNQFIPSKIITFIKENYQPSLQIMNENIVDKILEIDQESLILLTDKSQTSSKALEIVKKTAFHNKDSGLHFVFGDAQENIYAKQIINYLGFNSFPKIIILAPLFYNNRSRVRYFEFQQQLTEENLSSFLNGFKNKQLSPSHPSEAIPSNNTSTIKKIVGLNWNQIVNDETKDVLVLFYDDEYEQCKRFKEIYRKVAEEITRFNQNILFGQIDDLLNEIPTVSIEYYPQLNLYRRQQKSVPIVFSSQLNEKNLIQFIKQNTDFKWNEFKDEM